MITKQLAIRFPTATVNGVASAARLALWLLLAVIFAGPLPVVVALAVAVAIGAFDGRSWRQLDPTAWLRHGCEMLVAMYAGMLVYHWLVIPTVETVFGSGAPGGELRYAGMVASMVLPMAALMRIEGHNWQMSAEMTAAMVGPIVGCFALVGLGLWRSMPVLAWLTPTTVYTAAHNGMLLGMLVLMVVRRQMYGSADSTGHRHPDVKAQATA